MIAAAIITVIGVLILLALAVLGLLIFQGKRKPKGNPQYVALGSSFAAGIGLGKRAPASPLISMRSLNGYPQLLARMLNLLLVDVTSSGATAKQVLHGGQMFLGPQLDAITENTELVTITAGGNDIRYVGDLSFLAGRKSGSLFGWALRKFWKGPMAPEQRRYAELQDSFTAILQGIRRRAPRARIVVVTYPTILPLEGSCPKLGLTCEEAATMRIVGERLADLTRTAAAENGAILVDMQKMGAAHHACSASPWVNGWAETAGTQFHPTLEGASATARAIAEVVNVLD